MNISILTVQISCDPFVTNQAVDREGSNRALPLKDDPDFVYEVITEQGKRIFPNKHRCDSNLKRLIRTQRAMGLGM